MILADTDVLIDYLAGIDPVRGQIWAYAEVDRLQTSAITCFELLSGATKGRRGEAIRGLLAALPVLPLDRDAAVGMGDSLIAGIALTYDLPLFTRNRKHFERVPGLKLVEPGESS